MRDAYRRLVVQRESIFIRFVDKRVPAADKHSLSQKNLFIFPTKLGFIFLSIVFVLWVLGTNYQNNLILALAFFMISLFVLAILLTFQNLNCLVVSFRGNTGDAFVSSPVSLSFLLLKRSKGAAEEIQMTWEPDVNSQDGSEKNTTTVFGVMNNEEEHAVTWLASGRGRKKLPRLRVQSTFPLGIVRCWTWLRFNKEVIVFPQPVNGSLGHTQHAAEGEEDGLHAIKGGEDFSGLNDYRIGDSLKRVYWKSFARGRGMHVKEFAESTSQEVWLDYSAVMANSIEERLSILAYWVLQCDQENETFGLSLPSKDIAPGSGRAHRDRCLLELAVFR